MRLIDADALIKAIDGNPFTTDSVKSYIRVSVAKMPTIEERAKGHWILDQKSGRRICSECLACASRDDFGKEYLSDYCTVCGADMRGVTS